MLLFAHTSKLQGVARVLKYVNKSCLDAPDTPQRALDMSLKLLTSNSSVSSFIRHWYGPHFASAFLGAIRGHCRK